MGSIIGVAFIGWIFNKLFDPLLKYIKVLFFYRKLSKEAREIVFSFENYSKQYLQQPQYTIAHIGHIERYEVPEIINAWGNGINGILLLGTAGSGKSGIVLDLMRELRKKGTPVLFIRATDFALIADPATAIKQLLQKGRDIGESLTILGREKECVVIVDQLDSVSEFNSLNGFVSLLKIHNRVPRSTNSCHL